jgi:hypothetical protein
MEILLPVLTSCKVISLYIEVAHYFDQGGYPQALQWFQKVKRKSFKDIRDKFNLKRICI